MSEPDIRCGTCRHFKAVKGSVWSHCTFSITVDLPNWMHRALNNGSDLVHCYDGKECRTWAPRP